jgi:tetratricopeptide (TPR) repeat protein
VSLKGTLETFNLRELLQMLAFNQKDGTLVLETERGPRTIHLSQGRVGFVQGDRHASHALGRVLRRRSIASDDRLERAEKIVGGTGRFLGEVLLELGSVDEGQIESAYVEAVAEALFDLQMGRIRRFEFVEGVPMAPDGTKGEPIQPGLQVEGLLLDLTRKVDTWGVLSERVPSLHEVFEGTGQEADLSGVDEIDAEQAQRVVAQIDGYQDLEQVAEGSCVARYNVLQVAVAMLQGGAIRAVPSDDLVARAEDRLARGEARSAMPLLRRALERGDAPPHARLRMADALEAAGETVAAAAELDSYANLAEEGQEVEVFGALLRALKLREGDPISAGRVCDHYLRHRALLKAQRLEALDALRTLIHGASAVGRPLDAAQRLACFLQANEAPSDDLLVLADLYASGGDRTEAASALFHRAEDLLAVKRTAMARDCLRRALEYDPGRSDVRRRLHDLEGLARRARHRKRVKALLVLLGLLVLGAGGTWWWLSREATRVVGTTRDLAEEAVQTAERRTAELAAAFRALAASVEGAEQIPEELPAKARELLIAVKNLADDVRAPIGEHAARLEESSGGMTAATEAIVRGLDQRRLSLAVRAQGAVAEVKKRADTLLADGERANRAGEFDQARRLLLGARNLGFEDPTVRERASVLLRHVDAYLARCKEVEAKVDQARENGDLELSARTALAGLRELLDSDGTRRLRIPVALESVPSGAQVLLGGKPTDLVTPCVLAYGAFEDTTVVLRLPGRTSAVLKLPTYADVQSRKVDPATWSPRFTVDLPAGPRWVLAPPTGKRVLGLWVSGTVPVVLLEDGSTTGPVDPRTGVLGATLTSRQPNPMRKGGVLPGGGEWRIMGHRTLRMKSQQGAAWEVQVLGRLERAPALDDGVVCVVDEAGTLYGFALATGEELWRKDLGGNPAQAPLASPKGFIAVTSAGAVSRFTPLTGEARNLTAAGLGATLAVPWGDDVLVIGSGENGLRRVTASGETVVLGSATPLPEREPSVGPAGAAWATGAGVAWLAADAPHPVLLPALGKVADHVVVGPDAVLAVGADQVLRAVDPRAPDSLRWSVPLGGAAGGSPLVSGDAVFILVDGKVLAVER